MKEAPKVGETLGKGAGQMATLLTAVIVFHFWSWYGLVAYVLAMLIVGLLALAFQNARD